MSQNTTLHWPQIVEDRLDTLYKNISIILHKITRKTETEVTTNKPETENFDDSGNAYMYILFVLTFYAFSIIILMVKYIRREREGSKLEFYYNEFVKRDWYKDRNLYDRSGRRIYFTVDENNKVVKMAKTNRKISEDPEYTSEGEENNEFGQDPMKKPVVLFMGAASTAVSLVSSTPDHR